MAIHLSKGNWSACGIMAAADRTVKIERAEEVTCVTCSRLVIEATLSDVRKVGC